MLAVPIPVQRNLTYDMSGPKPRQKEGPVVVNDNKCISAYIRFSDGIKTEPASVKRKKLQSVKAGIRPLNLPGTFFFSVQLQVTSSRQTSSIRVLVAMEQPGDPTAVAFGDTETSSAIVSSPTGVIANSQAAIRSIGSQT